MRVFTDAFLSEMARGPHARTFGKTLVEHLEVFAWSSTALGSTAWGPGQASPIVPFIVRVLAYFSPSMVDLTCLGFVLRSVFPAQKIHEAQKSIAESTGIGAMNHLESFDIAIMDEKALEDHIMKFSLGSDDSLPYWQKIAVRFFAGEMIAPMTGATAKAAIEQKIYSMLSKPGKKRAVATEILTSSDRAYRKGDRAVEYPFLRVERLPEWLFEDEMSSARMRFR